MAATLYMFISPHYKRLSAAAFGTYLRLSVALFNGFPPSLFKRSSLLFPELIRYLFTLTLTWPEKNPEILNIVLASAGPGGGLVREVYRGLVRRSALGKEETSGAVMSTFFFYFSFFSFACLGLVLTGFVFSFLL